MLVPGLERSVILRRAGTLEIWLALAACSFRRGVFTYDLPQGWDMGHRAPELAGT